jgi:hypothetical protein
MFVDSRQISLIKESNFVKDTNVTNNKSCFNTNETTAHFRGQRKRVSCVLVHQKLVFVLTRIFQPFSLAIDVEALMINHEANWQILICESLKYSKLKNSCLVHRLMKLLNKIIITKC